MSLDSLKSTLGLGARTNKFRVYLDNFVADTDILAKASTLPDVTLGTVEVWDKGRKILLAGEAQYAGTWDVTFYNTADLAIRSNFVAWIEAIDSYKTEQKGYNDNSYMQDIRVAQLDSTNSVTKEIILHNAYPTVISTVDLDASSADSISEFTVTFTYSHWEEA